MRKKVVLLALIVVFCILVAPTFRGFPTVADTSPMPNANEGQFVFFQVNGGAKRSTSRDSLILEQALSFTKAVNKITARPGDQLTYTILFTNPSSSVILYNVQLTDIIPAYTSYITHSTNLGQATPVLPGSDAVIWNIGTLVPGQMSIPTEMSHRSGL